MAEQPIEITPSQLSRMQANAVLRERRRIVAYLEERSQYVASNHDHALAGEIDQIIATIASGQAVVTAGGQPHHAVDASLAALPTAEELNDDATPEGTGGMSDDEIAPVRERDDEEDMRALLGTRGVRPAALPRD